MKRLFKKLLKQKVRKKVAKYLRVLFVAVFIAGLLSFLATMVGLHLHVPPVTVVPISLTIGPAMLLFLVLLTVVLLSIACYILVNRFGQQISQTVVQTWFGFPIWARTGIVAALTALIATGSVLSTSLFGVSIPIAAPVIVFLLAFPLAAFLTRRYIRHDVEGMWLRALSLGGAVAILLAGVVVGYDSWYGAWVPDYYATITFLASWPILSAHRVRTLRKRASDPDADPLLAIVLIKSGYAQLERLETRTVAVLLGLVVALLFGFALWWGGVSFVVAAVISLLTWPLVGLVAFSRLEKKRNQCERTDLVVVEVAERESGETRELTVRNDGDEPISLTNAKIRDTEYNRYRLGLDVTIGVGERCTFDIPPEFTLEPNDIGYTLPFGYTLKQGAVAPVIYPRNGDAFALYHEDIDPDEQPTHEFDWHRTESSTAAGGEPAGQD